MTYLNTWANFDNSMLTSLLAPKKREQNKRTDAANFSQWQNYLSCAIRLDCHHITLYDFCHISLMWLDMWQQVKGLEVRNLIINYFIRGGRSSNWISCLSFIPFTKRLCRWSLDSNLLCARVVGSVNSTALLLLLSFVVKLNSAKAMRRNLALIQPKAWFTILHCSVS